MDSRAGFEELLKLIKRTREKACRGAQVFVAAYEMALRAEDLPAGIPLHDGWVFPAKDEAQLLRVKDVFEQVGTELLGQPMPVKHAIWN
jgi:hypothetical protein